MNNVVEEARRIVAEVFKVDPAHLTLTTSFVDDLGADSIDRIELIMRFEEAFAIEITREEALQVTNMEQALALLLPKVGVATV
jgi:acyl carrier protein